MKRGATLFLRAVLVLIGIGALAFLLWEPHVEGRNANADLLTIYLKDPFLAYVYVGSIPFFVGLFHGIRVLGYAARNEDFSFATLRSLRIIKYCAIALVVVVAGAEVYIFMSQGDDAAGGVAMGVAITFASIVVATAMAVLERAVKNALELKSENDLTV